MTPSLLQIAVPLVASLVFSWRCARRVFIARRALTTPFKLSAASVPEQRRTGVAELQPSRRR